MVMVVFEPFTTSQFSMMSYIAAMVMFLITVIIVSALFVPATYERKNDLVNFYWVGVWMFLGLIFCIAGAEQTLMLLGVDASQMSERILFAGTLCFVIFVVFGWARLSGHAAKQFLTQVINHRRAAGPSDS